MSDIQAISAEFTAKMQNVDYTSPEAVMATVKEFTEALTLALTASTEEAYESTATAADPNSFTSRCLAFAQQISREPNEIQKAFDKLTR